MKMCFPTRHQYNQPHIVSKARTGIIDPLRGKDGAVFIQQCQKCDKPKVTFSGSMTIEDAIDSGFPTFTKDGFSEQN